MRGIPSGFVESLLTGGEVDMGRYSLREQLIRGLRVGGLIAIVTGVVLGVIYAMTTTRDIPFSTLTRDAAATLEGPWYTAALSNASVALTMVGSGIALFAASLLPKGEGRSVRGLLTSLALVMLIVAVDDLYMLHEAVFPEVGISATVVFGLYALAMIVIIWLWRDVLFGSTDYIYIVLAALALGVSVAIDVISEEGLFELPISGELIEDPAKILGMVLMTFYLIVTARSALVGARETDPA